MTSAMGISFRNLEEVRKRKGTTQHPQPLTEQQLQLRNKLTGRTMLQEYNFNPSTPINEYHPPLHPIKETKGPRMTEKTRR
jgi:hypothetical protein